MDAVHRGDRPGVARLGGGQDRTQARGRDSRPRGGTVLRGRQREEEGEADKWARYGSDSELGNEPGRRGSTCNVRS